MFSARNVISVVNQFGVFIRYLWIPSGVGGTYIYASKYLSAANLSVSPFAILLLIGKVASANDITIAVKLKWFLENTSKYLWYLTLNFFWLVALQGKNAISVALQWLPIIRAMHRIKVHLCDKDTFSNIHNSMEEVFLAMKFYTSIQSVSSCIYMNKTTH